MTRIRARQGHSVHVDVELEEKLTPDVLYHGMGEQSLASIMEKRINKGNRLYVHLSKTSDAAVNVGKRHGNPVVLVIDAKRMAEDGHKFFLSRNGVWLTLVMKTSPSIARRFFRSTTRMSSIFMVSIG